MIKAEEGANPSRRGARSPGESVPLPLLWSLSLYAPCSLPALPTGLTSPHLNHDLFPWRPESWPWALRPPGINQEVKGRVQGDQKTAGSPCRCYLYNLPTYSILKTEQGSVKDTALREIWGDKALLQPEK